MSNCDRPSLMSVAITAAHGCLMLPPPTCPLADGVQPVCNRCASGVQAVQAARNWQAVIHTEVCLRPPRSLQFALHAQSPRTECSNYFEIAGDVNTYVKIALRALIRFGVFLFQRSIERIEHRIHPRLPRCIGHGRLLHLRHRWVREHRIDG